MQMSVTMYTCSYALMAFCTKSYPAFHIFLKFASQCSLQTLGINSATFKWLYDLDQVWSLGILKPCGHLNLLVLCLWLFLNSLCGVAAHHPFIHFLLPLVLHSRLQGAGAYPSYQRVKAGYARDKSLVYHRVGIARQSNTLTPAGHGQFRVTI